MERDGPENAILDCPACGRPTDSLKQYRYVDWCVFFLAGAVWQGVVLRACPACMRQLIWRRCLVNAVPAHLAWLAGLLPWGLGLIAASHRPGHSRWVVRGVTPEMVVAREMARREVSWARVSAVLSVLLFWLPLVGLAAAALACRQNRGTGGWTRRVSQASLTASALVHAALVVLFVAEEMRW
jgi:hypothetical protein